MMKIARSMAVALLWTAAALAHADYPDKPIRLVVPYPPGGNIDTTARIVASGLSRVLDQSLLVDNRVGASGVVGAQVVAGAPADGYTMLLASSGALAPVKALNPSLKLDPEKDFVAAGPIARAPLLLVVRPDLPVHNLAEFIRYAKDRPGMLSMASAGTGGTGHLTGELFQSMSGTKFLHVPYKGSSEAITDLLGGRVDLTFDQPATTLAYVNAGKLRALGVSTLARSAVAPQLPTLSESGLPGFDASTTTGLMFPAGTSPAVVAKINAALRQVLRMPDTRKKFESLGSEVVEGSGENFEGIVRDETRKWADVVREANIRLP